MPRLATPVANRATDTTRARASRPRPPTRRRHFHPPTSPDLVAGALFTHTREPAAVADSHSGRVVAWNSAAEHLLGWSSSEALGQSVERLIAPGIVPLYRAALALRHQGVPSDDGRAVDVVVQCANGAQVHVKLSVVLLASAQEHERYVLLLMHADADGNAAAAAQKRAAELESQLEAAEARLRQLETGVGELARHVRRACASMRHVQLRTEAPQLGRLALAARVARRRLLLLEGDVDALGARTPLELDLVRMNLVPLVARVVSRIRAESAPHRFNMALPQGLTAAVDAQRFEQVLEILLERAMARARGGSWIDVDLRRPFVGQARLEVRDFGRPVSAADRQLLASGGRDERSLVLARSIVALHGGTLEFELPADGGVRAVVTLPTQRGRTLVRQW